MSVAMPEQHSPVEVQLHDAEAAHGFAERVWRCYQEVFGDFDDLETWRHDLFLRHVARTGYRLAVGLDGNIVAGFAWGYVGERGQYWTDLVCDVLPPDVSNEWAGGHFEFVELAVLPGYRRQGLGLRLHDTLLTGVTQRCLLSTADDLADPAVRLYLRQGWQKLGNLRPDVQVMGRAPSGCA
jgi:ribosomal protein S18 acetylase RimI-like enzyme